MVHFGKYFRVQVSHFAARIIDEDVNFCNVRLHLQYFFGMVSNYIHFFYSHIFSKT